MTSPALALRARVKPLAEIPREALCCDKMEGQLLSWALSERILKIIPGRRKRNCKCLPCGAKFTGVPIEGMKGWYIDPRAWDIEEAAQ